MYELNDERAAISAIQSLLRGAGYDIKPDGIYGDETANAVRQLQIFNRLPPTGMVDLETFNALVITARPKAVYTCALLIPDTLEGGVISPGEENNLVVIIQSMLKTLEVIFEFAPVNITGIYDAATEDGLMEIQRINGLPQTGVINEETWNALVREYEKYKDWDS